jgi:hypothetical protein
MAIWEASISNFAHWERALSTRGTCQPIASDLEWPKVVWVPPITPLPDIEKTCVSVIGKPRSSRMELMRGIFRRINKYLVWFFNYLYIISIVFRVGFRQF